MNIKKVYLYTKRISIIIFTFWFVIFFIPHCFIWCGETIFNSMVLHEDYLRDYKMKKYEIRDILKLNKINLGVCNLRGTKEPPGFFGKNRLYVAFNFKNKNLQTITNELVNSWEKNKNYRGLRWNESSKWEIIKEPIKISVANKNIINLTFPKGSLTYFYSRSNDKDKNWSIKINTNNMECVLFKQDH